MTTETTGAQARPERSGFSTIVSLTDMPTTTQADGGAIHALVLDQLDEDQAQDVVSIPLEGKSSIADHMVIASGRSTRQVAAIATKLAERLKKEGHGTPRVEGLPAADWVLIDAGDVVVHLFRPEVRSFYNLERMWGFGDDAAAAGGRA
jgi:ribosome-associated protein